MESGRDQLTNLQRGALSFILACVESVGEAPTTRELMEGLMLKNQTDAYGLVTVLMRKGYVSCEPGRKRGITVIKDPNGMAWVHRAKS